MTENHPHALVSFLMDPNTKKEAATPTNWVLTNQPKANEIFAGDKAGETVIVGDIVSKKGKRYKVRDIIWDVSGDGLYEETVFLVVENTRTGKVKTFTDNAVSLQYRPDNSDDKRWSEYLEKQIFVWRFDDAPPDLRALSPHGGDEDWVTFIPEALEGVWIGWAEKGTSFGCCEVSEHAVPGGKVRIGAHA